MSDNIGKLILRLALGGSMLIHGIAKLTGGIGPIFRAVAATGLPEFVAYGVFIGQVLAPIMVLIGWYTRIGAGLIAVTMLFAVGLVHMSDLFALNRVGGWALELQGMYFFTAIAIALIGPGKFSLNAK